MRDYYDEKDRGREYPPPKRRRRRRRRMIQDRE
jgi:hypothetical protein